MRYLFGFLCVCALGLMPLVGCETTDNGGTGGTTGGGGVVSSCVDVENFTPCRVGDITGFCHEADCLPTDCSNLDDGVGCVPEPDRCCGVCEDGSCTDRVSDCTGFRDWTQCAFVGNDGFCIEDGCVPTDCDGLEDGTECMWIGLIAGGSGLCEAGSCVSECEVLEEGSACNLGDGVCVNGSCEPRCDNDADCTDYKDCTADTCLSNGLCESVAVQDGTLCAGGTCQSGECVLETLVLPCTEQGIRNAIAAGGDEPYTFGCVGPTTVTTVAVIFIDNDVILDGEGNLTVDGDEDHRVFSVREVTAELRGFTVRGGDVSAFAEDGGGIFNKGNLTVENSSVSGNKGCSICSGGGIWNEGTLMLTSSTVSGNNSGTGAGLHNDTFATATVTNSTVSGNIGGGLYNPDGTLTVTNTTVSGNAGGFGIRNGPEGTLTVANSLIDGDCDGIVTSNRHNIESPGDTCGFDQTGDLVNITEGQLDLGELANNGGATETHALGADSDAIDHIPAVDCGVTTDQRGEPRPVGDGCDVGSFERQPEDP